MLKTQWCISPGSITSIHASGATSNPAPSVVCFPECARSCWVTCMHRVEGGQVEDASAAFLRGEQVRRVRTAVLVFRPCALLTCLALQTVNRESARFCVATPESRSARTRGRREKVAGRERAGHAAQDSHRIRVDAHAICRGRARAIANCSLVLHSPCHDLVPSIYPLSRVCRSFECDHVGFTTVPKRLSAHVRLLSTSNQY